MAKKNILKNNNSTDNIQINLRDSVPSNVKRNIQAPVMEEADFSDFNEDEAKEVEIDQGLNEIYQDENGDLVDVHKLEKIRRKGFFLSLINFLFLLLILGGGAYWLYENWYKNASLDESTISFSLTGEQEVVMGEEYFYEIKYKNGSRTTLENVKINISVANNFILKDAEPAFGATKGLWDIGEVLANGEGVIKVKGSMFGSVNENGVISAYMSYSPEGFSTEYKKESFATTKIIDTGLDIDIDYYESVMVGETEEILIKYRAMDMNFIDNFRMSLEPQENITILDYIPKETATKNNQTYASFTIDRPSVWEVVGVLDEERVVPVRIKVNEKAASQQNLVFKFEKKADDGQYYEFYSETIVLEAMKNNLNLTMIVNGERDVSGVDFGEVLNYSIVYNNKGDADIKDVVIMAVLSGDYLDWTTLDDKNKGREKGSTITWSKEEIPALAEIKQDQEGVIDFSIKVFEFGAVELKGNTDISAYARFSVGKESEEDTEDNKSNKIVSKINSDLNFEESIRYFNEDNIPVGTGPNPPQVGQTTTYKVYWKISNNLHELNKLGVTLKLPSYVSYDGKDRATAGSIVYSQDAHEVVWNIGRLPTSVYQVSGEFSVKVTPTEEDMNKIMVLLPGSKAQAVDAETGEALEKSSKAKTTKLEDDEIGTSDGIVE